MGIIKSKEERPELDVLLEREAIANALQFKVLLLGAGESGKSTVIKQLRLIHQRKEMTDKWFMSWVPCLHANAFQCIQQLLQQAEKFGYALEGKDKDIAEKILAIKTEEEPVLTEELAKEIDHLWKLDQIVKTYERRTEFWLLEAASYYFEHLFEMAKPDFKPTEEHVVMARARTTGIITTEIQRGDILWKFVDVGGQRSERKKWIRCFDDVKAVLFIVNLAGYNSVLFEDQKKNRIHEELELFQEVCANPVFKQTPIFLFFNKKDMFEDYLRKYPLSNLFPEYKGGENLQEGLKFMENQFKAKMDSSRLFRAWPISARFKKDIQYSFKELMDELCNANQASISKAVAALKKSKKQADKKDEDKKQDEKKKDKKAKDAKQLEEKKKEAEAKEQEQQASIDLDRQLEEQRLQNLLTYKVLCLGPGESGKSTFIKQLKLIYLGKPSKQEVMGYVPILHQNAIQCMQTLLKAGATYGFKLTGEGEIDAAKVLIKLVADESPELTQEVADAIDILWKAPAIKQAYAKREEFWLLDSADYYFDHAQDFAKPDFVPSEDDMVMARARTTGIIESLFKSNDINWKVVDVGGQRSERKKWIKCFDDVRAILFVINLGGYNSVLFEDQQKNRMIESLELFEEICKNPSFKNTPIFLYLNKKDLFEEKLRTKSIVECFPDFKGDVTNTKENLDFIISKFQSKLLPTQKDTFRCWPIAARYKKDVKYSFREMVDVLLAANSVQIKKTVAALNELHLKYAKEDEKRQKKKDAESKKKGSKKQDSKKNVKDDDTEAAEKAKTHRKLLLLGPGESGKSTLVKQLKFLNNSMTKEEISAFVPTLHINVLISMKSLLSACKDRDLKFDEEANAAVERVMKAADGLTPGSLSDKVLTKQLAEDITLLWGHETVKKAWESRNEYWILENAPYFFEHVKKYVEDGYQPSEMDVILGRARTTGVFFTKDATDDTPPSEYKFVEEPYTWTVVDVGGQRSERRKWPKCYENVTAVVYVVNLAGYNSVLFEDQKRNRMQEALTVFEEIISNPLFKDTPIYVLLNKKDLFEQSIKQKNILQNFPDYSGKVDISMENITFIANKFRNKLKPSQQEVFEWWVVSASERKDVKYCFEEIKEAVGRSIPIIQQRIEDEKQGTTPGTSSGTTSGTSASSSSPSASSPQKQTLFQDGSRRDPPKEVEASAAMKKKSKRFS